MQPAGGSTEAEGRRRIRLLVVDDQPLVRQGLRMRLNLEADLEIVGEASDGEEALAEAGRTRPDVVVMDVNMPGVDGITTTRQLRQRYPDMAIIILSVHDDTAIQLKAAAAGATAFIEKRGGLEGLLRAIRAARSG